MVTVVAMGKVLNPMQAAILRAMAKQQGLLDEEFDEADFGEVDNFWILFHSYSNDPREILIV